MNEGCGCVGKAINKEIKSEEGRRGIRGERERERGEDRETKETRAKEEEEQERAMERNLSPLWSRVTVATGRLVALRIRVSVGRSACLPVCRLPVSRLSSSPVPPISRSAVLLFSSQFSLPFLHLQQSSPLHPCLSPRTRRSVLQSRDMHVTPTRSVLSIFFALHLFALWYFLHPSSPSPFLFIRIPALPFPSPPLRRPIPPPRLRLSVPALPPFPLSTAPVDSSPLPSQNLSRVWISPHASHRGHIALALSLLPFPPLPPRTIPDASNDSLKKGPCFSFQSSILSAHVDSSCTAIPASQAFLTRHDPIQAREL